MGKTPDDRLSHPYIKGVNAFINFARAVVDLSGNISCSCIHCVNCYRQSTKIFISIQIQIGGYTMRTK